MHPCLTMSSNDDDSDVFQATAHITGKAFGRLLTSSVGLSFWGGVDPQTGQVIDRHHPLCGKFVNDTIFAIPSGRGSCTGSAIMLELLLNEKAPRALVFERPDDILILGVIIAAEVFSRSIPVIHLDPQEFQQLVKRNGCYACVNGDRISTTNLSLKVSGQSPQQSRAAQPSNIQLSDLDSEFLAGKHGQAAMISMRIISRMAGLLGATELLEVTQVHIDGCIYTGPATLNFAERLRDLGAKVRVPTSLNSISIDQRRWRTQGVDSTFGQAAEKLATAYVDMGAMATFTCAPYLLETAPKLGDQVAWAESNAVVYANSVLGAKTMKYPDMLDICIALTGRAPKSGPHVETNRLPSLCVKVGCPEPSEVDDSFYSLLGYGVGTASEGQIPIVMGIESLTPCKDDLKAFGAAFATVSSAPMFHISGITPEALTVADIMDTNHHTRTVNVELSELCCCWEGLNGASPNAEVDLVSLGSPHFSLKEIRKLDMLCDGRKKSETVSIIVTCGRATYGLAEQAGLIQKLESFGVQFVTDTCWCMITDPIIPPHAKLVLTNSAKYAHYGPGLTGRQFCFGSLNTCVESACCGTYVKKTPSWL